jgi:spore germination cell wall hydrolase CwlJ-like protein
LKPGQFSAWNLATGYAGGKGGLNMDKIKPSESAYKAADALLAGKRHEAVGDRTHYYAPKHADPKWGKKAGGDWLTIGNHVFGWADAGKGK